MGENETMRAHTGRTQRGVVTTVVSVVVAMVATSCLYFPAAVREISDTGDIPWWCEGTPDLSEADCRTFSAQLDVMLSYAHQYPTVADFTATGASEIAERPADIGVPFGAVVSTFNSGQPNVLLYDGNAPGSRLVGVAYALDNEPVGFAGLRDTWTAVGEPATYWLPLWVIRGYENHPDVFAPSHPCLASGVTLGATTDACFLASHTEPLEILVTNDDGVGAPGIDALVEGLLGVDGVSLDIVAPLENQSGKGDTTTPGGAPGAPATTASGRTATAVDGFPADAVNYALQVLGLSPDLVLSGINEGQNMSVPIVNVSGTVGAARTAARNGVPAIASSQGTGGVSPADFPAGTSATIDLLERWRLGLAGAPFMDVPSINIPSCEPGSSVRGIIDTVVAPTYPGQAAYVLQDCTSTDTVVTSDVEAFNKGFAGVADVGLGN